MVHQKRDILAIIMKSDGKDRVFIIRNKILLMVTFICLLVCGCSADETKEVAKETQAIKAVVGG